VESEALSLPAVMLLVVIAMIALGGTVLISMATLTSSLALFILISLETQHFLQDPQYGETTDLLMDKRGL
jgi:hypothetical protein